MSMKSLNGRGGLEELEKAKVNYIKTLVHSRVPKQSMVDLRSHGRNAAGGSLSKSCQTIRDIQKKKSLPCEHNIIIILLLNWLINFFATTELANTMTVMWLTN